MRGHTVSIMVVFVLVGVLLVGCTSNDGAPAPTTSSTTTTTMRATTTTTTAPEPTTTSTVPQDVTPPAIVTVPAAGDSVDWYQGDFGIQTEPGATLMVDGLRVDPKNLGTHYSAVTNRLGLNTVFVAAADASGNLASEIVEYRFEPDDGWVVAIGDSVMLGTAIEIEKRLGEGIVDATVSRQFLEAPDLVEDLMRRAVPPQVIIIGLGTNGPVQASHFDEVMEKAGTGPLMVFVNVRVPRPWEGTSNREIEEGVERHSNAVLVDWYGPTHDRDELFAADGVHPKQAGRVILAELIAEAIFPDWEPLPAE